MAIHYDAKSKRFRDERGRLVSKDRAMRSSVARREYEQAQRKRKVSPAKPPTKQPAAPPAKKSPAKKPPAKKPPAKKSPAKKPPAKRAPPPPQEFVPPWEIEGIVREYPEPDEWFPEVDWFDYDDVLEDWGNFTDEETDS